MKNNHKNIKPARKNVKTLTLGEILKMIPKTLYVITAVLIVSGILVTSFGIYSMAKKAPSNTQTTVDVVGELVAINNNDKNITVKYPFDDKIYTVILDHYESGMQVGDSVDLKINPNELSSVYSIWALLVTVIGVSVMISAVCVLMHTVVLFKNSSVTLKLSNYAWIISAVLSFVSCGLGIMLAVAGKSSSGIALALAGGAVFTSGAWFLYIFGNKNTYSEKAAKSRTK